MPQNSKFGGCPPQHANPQAPGYSDSPNRKATSGCPHPALPSTVWVLPARGPCCTLSMLPWLASPQEGVKLCPQPLA